MMSELYRRIIPKILLAKNSSGDDVNSITTRNFNPFRVAGRPISQAKIFQANIADELIVLNVDKKNIDHSELISVTQQIGNEIFMPLSVGGGIEHFDQALKLFEVGVEKIVLDSIFSTNPGAVEKLASRFGSQSLIGSCTFWDTSETQTQVEPHRTFLKLDEIRDRVKLMEELGVGEIMINDASRDGRRGGSNLDLLVAAISITKLPVIDSCGFGKTSHFIESFLSGSSAVAVGTYFAYVDQSILQLRNQLSNYGIRVRTK
jgi:cyclase